MYLVKLVFYNICLWHSVLVLDHISGPNAYIYVLLHNIYSTAFITIYFLDQHFYIKDTLTSFSSTTSSNQLFGFSGILQEAVCCCVLTNLTKKWFILMIYWFTQCLIKSKKISINIQRSKKRFVYQNQGNRLYFSPVMLLPPRAGLYLSHTSKHLLSLFT